MSDDRKVIPLGRFRAGVDRVAERKLKDILIKYPEAKNHQYEMFERVCVPYGFAKLAKRVWRRGWEIERIPMPDGVVF